MSKEKRENPIGYRPSEKMKALFEKYCGEKSKISKSELVEIALSHFSSLDDSQKQYIMSQFIFGDTFNVDKKGDHKKAG